MTRYDWVKNALDRYKQYMEKHGKEGIPGLPTGHSMLDSLTGGWRDDDLILLSGRTNEKSLVGLILLFKYGSMYSKQSKCTNNLYNNRNATA